jgi:CysZ protein
MIKHKSGGDDSFRRDPALLSAPMLIEAIFKAWREVLSPPFRRILWRSLGLTALLLVVVWLALTRLFGAFLQSHTISGAYPILDTIAFLLAGVGLFVALIYLLPPVSALVASYFLDEAAARVEADHYPGESPGEAMPLGRSLLYGLRFAGLSLVVNAVALMLLFIPGVNLIAFLVANGYLLGREYFELAAARFRPLGEVAAMRRRHRGTVFVAGVLLALMIAVPVVNLLTPLVGIALMVHVHKQLSRREAAAAALRPSAAAPRLGATDTRRLGPPGER